MRHGMFIVLFFLCTKCLGQSTQSYDSLISKMCQTLGANKNETDTVKLKLIATQHLWPYLEKFDTAKAHEISNDIFVRAQRQCKDFGEIIFRLIPKKSDWERVDKKPISHLVKSVCRDFQKLKNYSYLETNGDTAHITIEDGFWIDHFNDSTFSKLKMQWLSDCEFQIEFVSSNNQIRKRLSKPGDKYRYQVLEKSDGYYFMSAEVVGVNQFMTFKLYY